MTERKPYPSDVGDEEWALVAPYLVPLPEGAPQRTYPLREVFNGRRSLVRAGASWRLLAAAVQEAIGEGVELAYVDVGYTGDRPAQAAAAHGIALEVVTLADAKRGFVLLPRRWVVERRFGLLARFRRLGRDYGCLAQSLAGLHLGAFAVVMASRLIGLLAQNT